MKSDDSEELDFLCCLLVKFGTGDAGDEGHPNFDELSFEETGLRIESALDNR